VNGYQEGYRVEENEGVQVPVRSVDIPSYLFLVVYNDRKSVLPAVLSFKLEL
jgi:hypothetical protein